MKHLQRAVHGGDVQTRQALAGLIVDFLDRLVAVSVGDCFQDHPPLGRDAETSIPQASRQFLTTCHQQFLVVAIICK